MKGKLGLLAVVVGVATLALVGVLRDVSTSKALMPLPVQPYWPDEVGGLSSTQLDQPIENHTVTNATRGQRLGESVVYYAPGFQVAWDEDITDGTVVGSVISNIDFECDSIGPSDVDIYAQSSSVPPDFVPYDWEERTTAVESTPEEYLKVIMPPFPWLLRLGADMDNIWLYGTTTEPISEVLNTVYASVPWSPNQDALAATTRQGGDPAVIPPSDTCLDSPQSSTSITSTSVWTNPALKGDTDEDTIDDATGLYPRWTAFQSDPDDRKSFQSPPSIASDTGYVERIVDLQCFWLDEDGCYTDEDNTISCDDAGDGNGYIDEVESWNDWDLEQLGGIDVVDEDLDCLIDPAYAQPGRPVDELDEPTGTPCAPVPYSEAPNVVIYDEAADQDCDGLVDGIEKAWGSNPQMADSDGDGASDFVEMFQFTNPGDPDTDGDGLLDKPEDDYIAAAAGSLESGETVTDDNCPGIYNPDQANNDGKRRDNGSGISGTWASNPNQDKMGDACDPDDDNDAAPGTYELATALSDPTKLDSDGDTVNDGAEIVYKTDPMDSGSKPGWSAAIQQKYYRGCHHNLPENGTYGGLWDYEYDWYEDDVEMDLDGDDSRCAAVEYDKDSDNGTGTKAAAPEEFADQIEAYGFGTGIANKDTDGDGCEDWIEIADVNGNRTVGIVDVLIVAQRHFGITPPTDSDPLLDVNKNGSVGIVDVLLVAKNSSLLKPHATCPSEG